MHTQTPAAPADIDGWTDLRRFGSLLPLKRDPRRDCLAEPSAKDSPDPLLPRSGRPNFHLGMDPPICPYVPPREILFRTCDHGDIYPCTRPAVKFFEVRPPHSLYAMHGGRPSSYRSRCEEHSHDVRFVREISLDELLVLEVTEA